jgi:hypothetical protein
MSDMISYMIIHDIRHVIMYKDAFPFLFMLCSRRSSLAQPADETDDDHEPDRAMDFDEERDFADQGPLTEMDMEEDAKILSLLLKHMPSCIDAADIEQLVNDIPVQPPVVVPVRTVQEAVAAGDLTPLDADAANVFLRSERILQDHFRRHNTNAAESKDRGGEDQGRATQREQDQDGRDKESSQRGRCSSGGGARRRRSGLNTGL